jgi:IrrE N-terminal-like domain
VAISPRRPPSSKQKPPPGEWAQFLRRVEDYGAEIRAIAKVSAGAPLDPRSLAPLFKVFVIPIEHIAQLSANDKDIILGLDPATWSGGGVDLPDGLTAVVLHPSQTQERAASTLLEEIAHAHLKHPPSRLIALPGGLRRREYDSAVEREAYWTAAAALLPAKVVARAVWQRAAGELSTAFGVSLELVEFRIKILGLWQEYKRQK